MSNIVPAVIVGALATGILASVFVTNGLDVLDAAGLGCFLVAIVLIAVLLDKRRR